MSLVFAMLVRLELTVIKQTQYAIRLTMYAVDVVQIATAPHTQALESVTQMDHVLNVLLDLIALEPLLSVSLILAQPALYPTLVPLLFYVNQQVNALAVFLTQTVHQPVLLSVPVILVLHVLLMPIALTYLVD